MKPTFRTDGGAAIVYDAERVDQVTSVQFEPRYWEERGAMLGQASGRGTTWFVDSRHGQWALRHYRRGGLVAKFVEDRYLWLGLARTRAWREWHLIAELHRQGLPVPVPLAARVRRSGITYTADLITQRIEGVEPVSRVLAASPLSHEDWQELGRLLRCFHDAGLDHADLNAHNILRGTDGHFWLIDFDKARLRAPGRWREMNLRRLSRSLRKVQGQSGNFFWGEADWAALRAGYGDR